MNYEACTIKIPGGHIRTGIYKTGDGAKTEFPVQAKHEAIA